MCSYSYFPRVEGMLDDGINAFSMEFQQDEFFRNQPVDIQECFKAYGVENYVDMLGKMRLPARGIRCIHIQIQFLRHPNVEK